MVSHHHLSLTRLVLPKKNSTCSVEVHKNEQPGHPQFASVEIQILTTRGSNMPQISYSQAVTRAGMGRKEEKIR